MPPIDPAALTGWDRSAAMIELGGRTMGTGWRVRLAPPRGLDPVALDRAITGLLERLVAELSHWEPVSLLSRFNRAAAGTEMRLPPDLAAVMAAGLDIASLSGGAFDPAIGALVDLWGFGPPGPHPAPRVSAVAAARAASGWHRLRFDAVSACLTQPGGVRLDLSGIAKGHAVDRVADLLSARGVGHALVEIGGEFVGRGLRPDGDPWWVELETPGGVAAPIRVALHGLAAATSGDYVRGRHTIDPRTGMPVAHSLAVSVLHPRAMLADGWATALGVLAPDEMRALAEREGLAVRALIRGRGGVEEWISPALTAMLAD